MSENKVLDSGSRLLDIIRKQIPQPRGIELATVIQADPLIIRIDNMALNLQGDDLIICERLVGTTQPGGSDGHTHQSTALANGDKLVVLELPGGQQFLVIDKAVMVGA